MSRPSGTVPGQASGSRGPAAGAGAGGPVSFKASCPDCGARFELDAGALRLVIGGSRRTTFYSFTCPECGAAVRKPAGQRIVELLTGGGVSTLRSV
ncbi:CpXC domain-containing protein [Streptomyces sp. ISL-94]|uniref:CpXC domain-containing protein n=1 Tax=Streptomyces sp. ISL-94 TaxID=2819190 RepID=UPI0020356F4A|nr:CpXC domain-containing protein [Streptomyces sp. ISL-94]